MRIIIGTIAAIALLVSCSSLDPIEEATRVNAESEELLSRYDTSGTPAEKYVALVGIRNMADSIVQAAGANFKKRKYEKYSNAVVRISDNPTFQSAWQSMAEANRSELEKIPSGIWLVNADSVQANTIFKLDKARENIVPYNIKGSNRLDFESEDNLIYSHPLEDPVFFFCNDSTGMYEISIPDRYCGRFRKAKMSDLAMGHYDCTDSYGSKYPSLEISNGKAKLGNKEYRITVGKEKFFGTIMVIMHLKNFKHPIYKATKDDREGCYDSWGLLNLPSDFYFWSRKILDEAENILYIFGEPEQIWNPEDNISENHSSSSGNSDWDEVLDSYEECVNKYISLIKKAAEGDLSAISSYAEFAEKAMELSEKISEAEDDMTASQLSRYMEITGRMTSAAASVNF